MFRRANRTGLDRKLTLLDDAVGNLLDHLLEQHPQMRVWPVIGRRNMFDAVGVS